MGDEQTIQCPKNDIWTNNDLQNSTQETKYCWARIPLEIRGWTWVLQNGKQFLLHLWLWAYMMQIITEACR